jgi:hypothetical protein
MPNLIKTSSAVLELFHVNGQTDRDTYSYIMNRQIFGTFHYERMRTHKKKVLIQIMCVYMKK